ncbi:hypothetical protein CALCODRAFT_521151 [Calocera cornea HHB12733]|uniref:Tetraspanin Tsp2 n=1 Tax=Calocera cornea HHB12733 TaxID=1353952 RepID=A0A165D054_9BASI|nr:hypothetical protein CALCODRAFT_521151 [Calocera cornea HHB12733]
MADTTQRPRRASTSSVPPVIAPRISTTRVSFENDASPLAPPSVPFAASPSSSSGLRPPSLQSLAFQQSASSSHPSLASPSNMHLQAPSLSLNYIPAKFSRPHSPGSRLHNRKSAIQQLKTSQPRGGGRAAFALAESRMPEEGDEDYDGWITGKDEGKTKPRLRWNRFKWALFVTNVLMTAYTLTALVFLLLTWFNTLPDADVIRTANHSELVISTVAAALGLLTSLIGWSGILLNNRAFLGIYCLLLWISFAFLCAPGYITYKRRAFNLEGKINSQWSREIGVGGRLKIQNQLKCCGYYSPFVEATISQTCYARSTLPGCKAKFLKFERTALENWYTIAFALVPLHLIAIVVSLLCSNHVTYRFGKGMMPRAYRLNMSSMAVLMDNYASQLAEQYNFPASNSDVGLRRPRTGSQGMDSLYFDKYADGPAPSIGEQSKSDSYEMEETKKVTTM